MENTETIQAAKARFARQKRKKLFLSFDRLYGLFMHQGNTFSDIARTAGVSREMIRIVYNRYFKNFFPNRKSTREILEIRLAKRRFVASKEIPQVGRLKEVMEEALLNNLEVRRVSVMRNDGFSGHWHEKSLVINGKFCRVYPAENKWKSKKESRRYYSHACVSKKWLEQSDFVIFVQKIDNIKRYFVIPSIVLLNAYGTRAYVGIFLPIDKLPVYNNIVSRVDYWNYENAWHLLKKNTDTPSIQPSAIAAP